jgi:hypothetical protein
MVHKHLLRQVHGERERTNHKYARDTAEVCSGNLERCRSDWKGCLAMRVSFIELLGLLGCRFAVLLRGLVPHYKLSRIAVVNDC